MNILITGATGFIGRNLLKSFESNSKYKNYEIVLLTSQKIIGYKCVMHNDYTFSKEDFNKIGINKIDILIHLGAFTPKDSLNANRVKESIANIVNTEYLLKNLPSIPKKIIYTSTIDVYGTVTGIITEEVLTVPNSLYGQSKLFTEKMLEVWTKENNVILQILRIGHIYGEGEEAYKKILPITINRILENKMPIIYTNGKEKRSFLYVNDCCNILIRSIDLDEYVEPINVVSNKSISIIELVNIIIKISGKIIKPIVKYENINTNDFIFNNDKMVKYLGKENIPLEEGIMKEYEYFKNK
jgi:nucleoside-diphosphate-sugar epimerase